MTTIKKIIKSGLSYLDLCEMQCFTSNQLDVLSIYVACITDKAKGTGT